LYEGPDTNWLISWMQLCQPYIKNAQVCVCPSWSAASGYTDGVNVPGGLQKAILIPYESYTTVWGGGAAGQPLGKIPRPAETIYGFEMVGTFNNPVNNYPADGYYCGQVTTNLVLNLNSNGANMPHNGGMNNFFVDGHAKWMSQWAPDGSNFTP
jgi:prepilin-type processing-associated H-X9-DG protein